MQEREQTFPAKNTNHLSGDSLYLTHLQSAVLANAEILHHSQEK